MQRFWEFSPPRDTRLHIAFGYHMNTADIPADFAEQLLHCDLYIPEMYLYSNRILHSLYGTVAGDRNAKIILGRSSGGAFGREITQLIFDSPSPLHVAIADIPHNSYQKNKVTALDQLDRTIEALSLPFTTAVRQTIAVVSDFFVAQRQREQHILQQLPVVINKARNAPELANKKALTVYMTLGQGHYHLVHPLQLASALHPDFYFSSSRQQEHTCALSMLDAALYQKKNVELWAARYIVLHLLEAEKITWHGVEEEFCRKTYTAFEQECMQMSFAEIRTTYDNLRTTRLA